MDVLKSRLAQHNGILAKEIEGVLVKAQKLGAHTGVQRIEFICDQYDKVPPDAAYRWIDLDGFQREIEDALARRRRVEWVHILRNILSLAPLIATWFALLVAVGAYQENLSKHPEDTTIPFLQQWQEGFHGITSVTFTTTAGIDVVLLGCLLLVIIISYNIERDIEKQAVKFIGMLRSPIEKLMTAIAAANITPIRAPSDIDKVTIAIKQIVDSATESIHNCIQAAQLSINQLNQKTEDFFQYKVTPVLTSFSKNTADFQSDIQRFQQQLQDLTTHTQQLAKESGVLATSAQSYLSVGKDIGIHVNNLNTNEQNLILRLDGVAGSFTSAQSGVTAAMQSMEMATQSVTMVATQLDKGVQATVTKMVDNVDRATIFQTELANFQARLQDLNMITQDFTQVTKDLASSAQKHAMLGQEINTRIGELNHTEQGMLTQLSSIAGSIQTASTNMSEATAGIQSAASSVTTIAQGLHGGVQTSVGQMTQNINRATVSLGQVENQLAATSGVLLQVAQELAGLDLRGSGGSGLIGALFSRGRNRAKSAGRAKS